MQHVEPQAATAPCLSTLASWVSKILYLLHWHKISYGAGNLSPDLFGLLGGAEKNGVSSRVSEDVQRLYLEYLTSKKAWAWLRLELGLGLLAAIPFALICFDYVT